MELKRGNSCSALTQARMTKASGVSFTPAASALSLRLARSCSSSVMSASSNCVTCGMLDPAGMQAWAGDALDARQRLDSPRGRTADSPPPVRQAGRYHGAAARCGSSAGECALDESLDVIVGDAALEAVARDAARDRRRARARSVARKAPRARARSLVHRWGQGRCAHRARPRRARRRGRSAGRRRRLAAAPRRGQRRRTALRPPPHRRLHRRPVTARPSTLRLHDPRAWRASWRPCGSARLQAAARPPPHRC